MPTPLRRRLRLARRGLAYASAIALVLVALVLAVASQLLPLAERNPARVAAWLSERAGQTVAFDAVETEWTRRGPLLQLDNLRIGEGADAFTIGDTEMLVSIYAGLLPDTPFSELRLRGVDLTLERADDGRWRVRGLPGQQQAADPFDALERLGELQVIDGKLAISAPQLGIDAHISRIDLRLRVQGERLRVGVRAWPAPGAAPLDAVLDFDRATGDGRAWSGAQRADLAAWSPLLRAFGVAVDAGKGRAQAWARLQDHRLAEVTLDAALADVGLRSLATVPGTQPARVRFESVEGRARWRMLDDGWRLDAPRLRIDSAGRAQTLDGLALAGGARFALQADALDAGPLLAVAGLSDRVPGGLRDWLRAARPQASLRRIEIAGARGGALHASARIDALGFEPVGDAPGLHGLAGDFHGDADGFALRADPDARLDFDWPRGFGVVHTVRLGGVVGGWREGDGWRVGTSALRIDGDGFGLDVRGGLWWQGDGSRPWIDLAAAIDDTALPVAKGFWLHHKMSPALIGWLDAALVAGTLRDARAIVSGDLDDWPFTERNGRFEANARLDGATLRFQHDWPALEQVDAQLSFVADGFSVEGRGRLGEVAIRELQAGIDHYGGGRLAVRASGAGDAGELLKVLRESPLREQHGDTLVNLRASGPARVGFGLMMPLRGGGRTRIDGSVELDHARLADRRWQLAFEQVTGRAEYSRDGFRAEDLRVRHDGQPGRLSLRAGAGYVDAADNVFEARLDAPLAADALIDRAPAELAWLKPLMDGRSPWTVQVAIPQATGGADPAARLQLGSDLVGTTLALPAPLRKPAGQALATTVEAPLPLGSGDIRVRLGDRLALRARSGNGRTGVRIALGGAAVEQAPPASGLVATGRAAQLDAIDWIALAHGGGEGGGLPLQRIDVTAHKLQLLGGSFADTRVVVAPATGGAIAVRAEGEALRGNLLIPKAEGAAVTGRFTRVYWTPARAPAPAAEKPVAAVNAGAEESAAPVAPSASSAATADTDDFDPSRIPPLALDVDELRIVDAPLGQATLRTRQTAAGLRIEQLRTRGHGQAIDVSGDWTGPGAATRTRLAVGIDSEDFGALLTGLGFGGRLAGGSGRVEFDAAWPGSPAAFALGALDGRLVLDARDGRLLELEPGAGRVLGLLSIAELPRRLTLDFGDFFAKGFAFNRITGQVRFADGVARSDDLQIDGPAAAIDIRGTANLRAQTYDQTIEVRPKAGNLLTVAGAIAGGPVGAAIGAAANAVLQKPLGEIAAKTYKVTGPWEEPKVEVISREQSRAAHEAAAPTG